MKKFLIKNLLAGFAFLLAIPLYAQQVKIVEPTTLQPISGVVITSFNPSQRVITNHKGNADITNMKNSDSIVISHVGYKNVTTNYQQLSSQKEFSFSEEVFNQETFVISASKFEEHKEDVPQQTEVLTRKDLMFMNQQTSADVLSNTGNISVQKSQQGGGSPVLRGFEASRVLLVIDGVRMNNAIYRAGHLQNVITLDNNAMDRVEIIYGPGSVIYGSDALGGVMHFYTLSPVTADSSENTYLRANAFTRFSSANMEKTGHLDFNIGLKQIAFLTSFTYSDFGDLRQGNIRNPYYGNWGKDSFYVERNNGTDEVIINKDRDLQKYSGYNQYDFTQKILFKPVNSQTSHTLNFQYSSSSDVPRYDRLELIRNNTARFAEWYYGPQTRAFTYYKLSAKKPVLLYNEANMVVAHQFIKESRHDRSLNNVLRNNRIEKVNVYSFNLDLTKQINKHELRYGTEVTYNDVNSTANAENIETGEKEPLDTRYPSGGATMFSGAAYLTDAYELSKSLILSGGLRYSYVGLDASFTDMTFFPFPYTSAKQRNGAFNGNLGVVYMPGSEWRFTALYSSGFKSPNVDDMVKIFESVPGNIILPNPDLKPEYTHNVEVGVSKVFAKVFRAEVIGFYTWYKNAFTTRPGLYNGEDSIMYDGSLSRVMYTSNAQEAYLYGLQGNISANLSRNVVLYSTLNYTYGRIVTDTIDYPLDHIPPVFGKTSLKVSIKKFRGECWVMYHAWKRLRDYNIIGEDNISQATPYGMPAWATINVRGAFQVNKYLQVQLALENILDSYYRVFGSGIGAPGRNLVVTVRGTF